MPFSSLSLQKGSIFVIILSSLLSLCLSEPVPDSIGWLSTQISPNTWDLGGSDPQMSSCMAKAGHLVFLYFCDNHFAFCLGADCLLPYLLSELEPADNKSILRHQESRLRTGWINAFIHCSSFTICLLYYLHVHERTPFST